MNLVMRTEFGSHLYGTNTATSDTDFKSVYIPTARSILLQRVKDSVGHKIKSTENLKNTSEDIDDEAYSLQRYLNLLAEGQTVAIDMLFAPYPVVSSDLWNEIRSNKELLLTRKAASFVGYCRTQANKYGIKGSRVAAVKSALDLFRGQMNKLGPNTKLSEIEPELVNLIGEHIDILKTEQEIYFNCCGRKIGYKTHLKTAVDILSKIYDNYGKRARLAESNEGIDWKALSHAVRVGNEAVELLTTGHVTFPLFNREHILAIKLAKISYEQVAEEIEQLLLDVESAAISSKLRLEPDYEFIDNLVYKEYYDAVAH